MVDTRVDAVDELDEVFRQHDIDYYDGSPGAKKEADKRLVRGIDQLDSSKLGLYGNLYALGAKTYFGSLDSDFYAFRVPSGPSGPPGPSGQARGLENCNGAFAVQYSTPVAYLASGSSNPYPPPVDIDWNGATCARTAYSGDTPLYDVETYNFLGDSRVIAFYSTDKNNCTPVTVSWSIQVVYDYDSSTVVPAIDTVYALTLHCFSDVNGTLDKEVQSMPWVGSHMADHTENLLTLCGSYTYVVPVCPEDSLVTSAIFSLSLGLTTVDPTLATHYIPTLDHCGVKDCPTSYFSVSTCVPSGGGTIVT